MINFILLWGVAFTIDGSQSFGWSGINETIEWRYRISY